MFGDITKNLDLKSISYRETVTLDDKGRILLPRKVRERLGDNFTVALGLYGGLIAVPEVVWKSIASEVRKAPILNPGRIYFASHFMGASEDEINFDSSGRFVVPRGLRKPGNLEQKCNVVLNGADIWLEIWNETDFETYRNDPMAAGGDRYTKLMEAYDRMQAAVSGAA